MFYRKMNASSRRRSHDRHADLNLQSDLEGRRMADYTESVPNNHTPKNRTDLQQCQNYTTINLVSHPIKVMLMIVLNRFQPHAEEISAEELAGFKSGRSTTEQIFSLRISPREIHATSAESQPYIHRFQDDFWQGMAWSIIIGSYKETRNQCQHHTSHWKSVWQGTEYSPIHWQHRKLDQIYSRSPTRVPTLTSPL